MNRVRHAAARTYRVLITPFAAAVIVGVFLAGLGVFGAMPGKNEPVSHDTFGDKFGMHAAIGGFLTGVSLLLVIVVLIARSGLRSIAATFGLAVLTLVEGVLGGAAGDASVAGAFHALNAVLVPGLAVVLTVRAWRGEPADPFRTASAHGTGACSVDVGPDTGRAGRVRRLRT
jgi:hypothetical protein